MAEKKDKINFISKKFFFISISKNFRILLPCCLLLSARKLSAYTHDQFAATITMGKITIFAHQTPPTAGEYKLICWRTNWDQLAAKNMKKMSNICNIPIDDDDQLRRVEIDFHVSFF